MLTATAIVWVLQALGGATLFAIWLSRGGHRQRELVYEPDQPRQVTAEERKAEARARGGESRIPLALISGHAAMAILGVAAAIGLAAAGTTDDGWEPGPWFLLLWGLALAALGVKMFLGGSEQRAQAARESPVELAEEGWPKPLVYLHGLGALAVLTLTLLVALEVGV